MATSQPGYGAPPSNVPAYSPPNVSPAYSYGPDTNTGGAGDFLGAGASTTPPPTNPLDSIWGNIQNNYRPQQNAIDSLSNFNRSNNYANAGYLDTLAGGYQSSYNNQLAKLGFGQQSNMADQNAISANRDIYGRMKDQYGIQSNLINQNLQDTTGFANQGYENTAKFSAAALQNFLAQNQLANTQANQAQSSSGVSGGFGMAPGQTVGHVQIDTSTALKAADAQNAQAQRLADALLGKNEKIAGATNQAGQQQSANTIQGLRQDISQNLDDAQLAKLKSASQSMGVDANTLMDTLTQNLAKNGLDKFMNAGQLLSMGASSNAQSQALYAQMMNELAAQAQAQGSTADQIDQFRQAHYPGA